MQLKDFRETKEVELKSLAGSKVTIYSGILYRDSIKVVDLQKSPNDPNKILDLLCIMIKDWNFTDSNNEKLPITIDNLNLLSQDSIQELFNLATEFVLSKKKE